MGRRLCKFNGVGFMSEASGSAVRAGKSEGGTGLVVVCVWRERYFEPRLGMDRLFGGKQGARRLRVLRGTECRNWELSFHAAAPASGGGERSWSWAALNRSMTRMHPPHFGQRQRGLASGVVDVSDSVVCGGAEASAWKQSGRSVARRRLARKPKWRMRTKPLGSRCNRKRRRN